jgi:hypothetical protein
MNNPERVLSNNAGKKMTFHLSHAEELIIECLRECAINPSEFVRQAMRFKFSRDVTPGADGFIPDPILAAYFKRLNQQQDFSQT